MKSKIRVKPIKYATKKSIVKARRLPFLIFGSFSINRCLLATLAKTD